MQLVKCISIRETNPNQIKIGNYYFIDITSIHSDLEGEWYTDVYEMINDMYYSIGRLALRHFIITN